MKVITMPDARYQEYCDASDFIRTHIFPGGHLPSLGAMAACAAPCGLAAVAMRDIGPSYAVTLREWRRRWREKWGEMQALGYPDAFMRKCAGAPCT
jgi:cyclopropane-fatty-acyl-phospholipid synthase